MYEKGCVFYDALEKSNRYWKYSLDNPHFNIYLNEPPSILTSKIEGTVAIAKLTFKISLIFRKININSPIQIGKDSTMKLMNINFARFVSSSGFKCNNPRINLAGTRRRLTSSMISNQMCIQIFHLNEFNWISIIKRTILKTIKVILVLLCYYGIVL